MRGLRHFRELYSSAFGTEAYEALVRAVEEEPSPVSIRLHPHKLQYVSAQRQSLLSPIPWAEDGFYVHGERPVFGADPLWHAGGYYVQEPGSMFISHFVRAYGGHPRVAIDLCAAPGGKSTLLRSVLPEECVLVANEPDSTRASILRENIIRSGADETIVTSAYPADLADTGLVADIILVDAPCSGEGMFRKEEGAVQNWSLSNVQMCRDRQRTILQDAWRMLRPGGLLIYSTCTYNRAENDDQLTFLANEYDLTVLDLQVPQEWGVLVSENVYRFIPGRVQSEGFTAFAVVKGDGSVKPSMLRRSRRSVGKQKLHPDLMTMLGDEQVRVYMRGESMCYLSEEGQSVLKTIEARSRVRVLLGGVPIGEVKGKGFAPNQGWICSPRISALLNYPRVELTEGEALSYLKRETLTLDPYKGVQIMTYMGLPIGAVKNIETRVNTLYPREMAIRNSALTTSDVPDWKNELQVRI